MIIAGNIYISFSGYCSPSLPDSDAQSTKVKMYMLDMTASLLQEGESISQALLDAILVNIIDPIKVDQVVFLQCSRPTSSSNCFAITHTV